jgi:micrococcal nuclease
MWFRLLLFFLCIAVSSPVLAARERLMAVKDDQTLVLAQTGNARLAELVMPDAALAQAWLAEHLLQQNIEVTLLGVDRYGRNLVASDAAAAMLRAGAAVYFPQSAPDENYVAAEADARATKRGIWGVSGFVLTPENAADHIGEFHVVEGAITRVYQGRNELILNFGERWQEDFSVVIKGRARRAFEEAFEYLGEGARVRVRGTLIQENGPMLRLTTPAQMEVIKR